MARPSQPLQPPSPPPPRFEPGARDWAVLALLALTEERIALRPLLEGSRELLEAIGLPAPATEAELREWLGPCQARGFVYLETWGGAKCPPDQRDRILLHAWHQGWSQALGKVSAAQRGIYEYSGYPSIHGFRAALITESFEDFLDMVGRFDAPRTTAMAVLEDIADAVPHPLDQAWLRHLPAIVAHLVAIALLNRALLRWESLAPLTDWLQGHPGLGPDTRMILVEGLLYQGRFQEAQAELGALDPERAPGWPPHLAGLLLFLEDRPEEALALFEVAWDAQKAANKRIRMPILPGPLGWFHALALLQNGLGDRAERLAKVNGGRGLMDGHGQVWDGILDLAVLAQGRRAVPCQELPSRVQGGPMACFLHATATCWRDVAAFRKGKLDTFQVGLAACAGQSGMPWFQAQTKALAARWQGTGGDGSLSLATCLEATPVWQRTLNALARLGQEAPAAKTSRTAKPKRLAWVLRLYRGSGSYEDWSLEAREQSQAKGGEWGPGRAIQLSRVRSASVGMAFLTPADHRAIMASSDRPYPSREDIWRILHALAGHEALFLESLGGLKPLQVRQGEPELRVRTEPEGLRLQLYPDCDGSAFRVVEDGPDRMTVYAFTPRHREVGELLGAQGLKVPAGAQDQVGKAVASLASRIAIHSEVPLGLASADLEEVAADATPELDLRPWGEGLMAQLRVRPVTGGPAFVPGEGAGELLLEVGGRRCRVQRDLPRERRLAQDLADACPALGGGGWEWPLEEPVDCLGLMLDLEPLKDQVRVAWPEGERFRTPQRAVASGLSLALRGEGQWFALDGRLQLDEGRVLSLQDLLDLLPKAKGAFVPLGDGLWLSLERHFRERLEGLRALAVPQGATLRLAPAAALALEDLTETVGSFTAPKAWKDRAAAIRRAFGTTFPVPPTLQARLRPYQEEGFQWLARLAEAGLGACLADDMGLGKTVQALALLLLRAARGPALVVAPTSVVGNWAVEARRFAPTLEVVVHGEGDRAALLENAGPYTLVLCSYGLLVQDQALLTARTWSTVILDEAQAVKNADTQRSKAVMALQAEARLVMSGTPVENHLGELWNLFRFLNPGLLGSAEHFTRTYALPIERDQNRASLRHLKRLLGPFLLRRAKQEVLQELPSLTEIVHEVVLSADERAFYEVLRRGALKKLSSAGPAGGPGQIQILAELMRLRRACCHPRLVEPGLTLASAKLEAFVEILAELRENRHRALVFSQFVDHLAVLREHLDAEQIPYQYLDGATPAPARRKRIDAFQAGAGDVFLISLKAGGTGLNLTAADYVIHMDPWWNPAVEDQASSRAHRYGQDRPVTVYRLVAKDTIEEKILALHHQKRKLAEGILEGAGTAAVFSAEDLMDLLRA